MQAVHEHVSKAEITAVITRADGTVEELGVIDSFDRDAAEGIVGCETCGARMRRYELVEHESNCRLLALAAQVDETLS